MSQFLVLFVASWIIHFFSSASTVVGGAAAIVPEKEKVVMMRSNSKGAMSGPTDLSLKPENQKKVIAGC